MPFTPGVLLRLEALGMLIVSVGLFATHDPHWGLFAALFLVPDVALFGLLVSPKFGAAVYNAAHTYVGPLLLWAIAARTGNHDVNAYVLIWIAHIAIDRLIGYGLKYPGLKATHLQIVSAGAPGLPA